VQGENVMNLKQGWRLCRNPGCARPSSICWVAMHHHLLQRTGFLPICAPCIWIFFLYRL